MPKYMYLPITISCLYDLNIVTPGKYTSFNTVISCEWCRLSQEKLWLCTVCKIQSASKEDQNLSSVYLLLTRTEFERTRPKAVPEYAIRARVGEPNSPCVCTECAAPAF
jgi:hypothetical protein